MGNWISFCECCWIPPSVACFNSQSSHPSSLTPGAQFETPPHRPPLPPVNPWKPSIRRLLSWSSHGVSRQVGTRFTSTPNTHWGRTFWWRLGRESANVKRCIRSRGATRKSTYKAPVAAAASTCCVSFPSQRWKKESWQVGLSGGWWWLRLFFFFGNTFLKVSRCWRLTGCFTQHSTMRSGIKCAWCKLEPDLVPAVRALLRPSVFPTTRFGGKMPDKEEGKQLALYMGSIIVRYFW